VEAIVFERICGPNHTRIFRDYVAAALVHISRERSLAALELLHRDVAQRAHAWESFRNEANAFLALRPPRVVGACGQLALHHAVANHQSDAGRQRHRTEFERTAIEKERTVPDAAGRSELVHDPASSADEIVFGFLAAQCELGAVDCSS